ARHPGKPTVAELDCPWDDMDITLPDSLFAELGYTGALDTDEAGAGPTDDPHLDSEFDSLFAAFAEPMFGALRQA
ncbi:MAG TPA: hypothetical protein PLR07_12520, partial [Promineifilum sp.]|nr:hypothetical protein [Promineifilum sp.]